MEKIDGRFAIVRRQIESLRVLLDELEQAVSAAEARSHAADAFDREIWLTGCLTHTKGAVDKVLCAIRNAQFFGEKIK